MKGKSNGLHFGTCVVCLVANVPHRDDLGNDYPLVNIQKAIENGHLVVVDLPIKNCDFPYLC